MSHVSTRRFSPQISQWQISLHKQVYEFAIDRFPDFALLRVSLAVELLKAGQVEDAKKVLKAAVQQDPQLRAVILGHPGLEEDWWP